MIFGDQCSENRENLALMFIASVIASSFSSAPFLNVDPHDPISGIDKPGFPVRSEGALVVLVHIKPQVQRLILAGGFLDGIDQQLHNPAPPVFGQDIQALNPPIITRVPVAPFLDHGDIPYNSGRLGGGDPVDRDGYILKAARIPRRAVASFGRRPSASSFSKCEPNELVPTAYRPA
jgi:hypothetical protein